ncbi:hypothetical protein TESG_00755 [Trichophyton tonsurans CBS 112818]|uniref:Uncharacterized protein n=2 Tax=Trichophyton TaxID=5550 RepID=F2PN39_TRIEC|nr:hypothetical protein TESG_00755 [Trichophyton tonsurans CBS 112818]EGE03307.1 hypothetical protein TEQG_02342 [Trichophyton equinum CBS 127.97]
MRAPAETEEKTKQNKASSRVSDAVLCCAVAGQVVSGKKERKITILYFVSSANIEPGWNRDVRACVNKIDFACMDGVLSRRDSQGHVLGTGIIRARWLGKIGERRAMSVAAQFNLAGAGLRCQTRQDKDKPGKRDDETS